MKIFSRKLREHFIQDTIEIPDDILDQTVNWIGNMLEPDDVFSEAVLNQWAFDNGFKRFD